MTVSEFHSLMEICKGRELSIIEYALNTLYLEDLPEIARAFRCDSDVQAVALRIKALS